MVRERTRMGYFKWLILLFCCIPGTFQAVAQVKYDFTRDTVRIKGGQTFTNLLRVVNSSPKKVILKQSDKQGSLTRGLINLPDSIMLAPGETGTFPLKYLADRQTVHHNIQLFAVYLFTADPAVEVQRTAVFNTQLEDVKGLTIDTEESEIYLSQLTNQVNVMIRCANNGFVPISFKLLLNGIPAGLEFTGQTTSLTLQPGTQQLLPFLARNTGGSRTSGDYIVTIQALDEGNTQLALKTIRILNVTSARKMGTAAFGGDTPNTVSLRYVSMGRGASYEQFQTNGKVEVDTQRFFEYRINVDRFQQSGYNGLNIYNTYVDYQSKEWGLKLGNIYENIDFNLGGRGIKATAKLNNNAALSFFGVENKYSLFNQAGQIPYFNVPDAKAFALDYFIEKGGKEDRRLTYLHSQDNLRQVKADQLGGKIGFKLRDQSSLGFEGGLSMEQAMFNTGRQRAGVAAGINYMLENDAIQLYSNSYYSSPYYTGLRRGIFSSSISFLRKLSDKNSVKAQVSMQLSSPKFQDNFTQLYSRDVNKSSVNIYELQYNTRIGKLYFNAGPYLITQRLTGVSYLDIPPVNIDWSSSSIRFKSYLNYNGRIHNFSITADYGYTFVNTSGKPPSPFHSLKINGSYNIAFLGFTSYVQLNPYYLSDVISVTKATSCKLYSLGPNLHFNALKNRLNMQVSGAYNYYGFTQSDNYSVTASTRLKLKGNWAFSGDVQYSVVKQKISPVLLNNPMGDNEAGFAAESSSSQFNRSQVRLGIEKQFGIKRAAGSKKLELTYFEDLNDNGSREANEAAVAGVLVKINGEAALTNSSGTVIFKNMNKEAYTACVTNTKGWSLQEPTVVFLDKNKHLEVPLVKTQALNGRLKVVAGRYLDSQPVLAGIRISAMDGNGRIHQTLTDDEGTFCFYLPQNKYTVYIETTGMPFSIENGRELVQLKGEAVEMLTFLYRDERRKVGIIRF